MCTQFWERAVELLWARGTTVICGEEQAASCHLMDILESRRSKVTSDWVKPKKEDTECLRRSRSTFEQTVRQRCVPPSLVLQTKTDTATKPSCPI